jgi:hypothetical protein
MDKQNRRPGEDGEIEATSALPSSRSPRTVQASDWKTVERNTLRGFCTLKLPSGLIIRECTWHVKDDSEWIGLPSRPQLDKDGNTRRDTATGRPLYVPVVEIAGKDARARFQAAALQAVHMLVRGAP